MFKSIVVALDGSTASAAGFKTALRLAADQHASLFGVHVLDSAAAIVGYEGVYVPTGYADALYRGLRKTGEAILAKAAANAGAAGVAFQPVLVDSRGQPVAQAILREARKAKADVIVIGTHGRRGLSRVLMGSDAEAVVRESAIPVLLVRSVERAKRQPAREAKRRTPGAGAKASAKPASGRSSA